MPQAKSSSSSPSSSMDRNLALETVRVTEAAALAASRLMGRGDEKAADQAAVNAMRQSLNGLEIDGTVVIGEGERDEAPMLFIGEKVGSGRSEEHTSELQSLMRISYAVFCLTTNRHQYITIKIRV